METALKNGQEIAQRIDHFYDICDRHQVKVTRAREEVFRAVASSELHPDVETIYKGVQKRIPRVSLDTVYRAVRLLRDLHLLHTVDSSPDRIRFDANLGPHHHFVCIQCETVYDFQSREYRALRTPAAAQMIGRVQETRIELRGICHHCSEATGKATKKKN
ncbi:MAG: transcriptional repressor [bacterium]|nr:transcriptional repressor [bacterium]